MKLHYHDTAALLAAHVHGTHPKDMAVLHETVSSDAPGFGDIDGVEQYLAGKDYGIHGMTDSEGNMAWAHGLGNAIFWQAGGVNDRAIGIEQVSRVMLDHADNPSRRIEWEHRAVELRATAMLLAAWHNVDPKHHVLVYSDGLHPGVTSHWDVSKHFPESLGHTDCWPVHKGGYYPILTVITMAQGYAKAGYTF